MSLIFYQRLSDYEEYFKGIWLVLQTACWCICSPEPSLTWSKVRGSMPISRYNIINYNTEFTIWNVQQSDEGDYLCRASNTNGAQDHTIQIDVQGELNIIHCLCLPACLLYHYSQIIVYIFMDFLHATTQLMYLYIIQLDFHWIPCGPRFSYIVTVTQPPKVPL